MEILFFLALTMAIFAALQYRSSWLFEKNRAEYYSRRAEEYFKAMELFKAQAEEAGMEQARLVNKLAGGEE